MFKRILLSTLAAGTVLMGVNAAGAAEGDQFVFRYKGGVIQLAAATPEVPEEPAEQRVLTMRWSDGLEISCDTNWTQAVADSFVGVAGDGFADETGQWVFALAAWNEWNGDFIWLGRENSGDGPCLGIAAATPDISNETGDRSFTVVSATVSTR